MEKMLSRRLLFAAVSAICAFTLHLFGQQTDETVTAMLTQSVAAMSATNVQDVTLNGTARVIAGSQDETGAVALKALAGGFDQIDISLSGSTRSEVRTPGDGVPVGTWQDEGGTNHNIGLHNLQSGSDWFFPAFVVANIVSSNNYVSYVGQESKDSQSVVHFTSILKSTGTAKDDLQQLSKCDVYLDARTLLPSVFSFNSHPDNDPSVNVPVEIHYSDYQSRTGALIPLHIEKYVNGTLAMDIHVDSIVVNSGLTAKSFSAQ